MSAPPLSAIGEHVDSVSSWTPERDDPDGVFTYVDLSGVDQDAKVVSGARELACAEAPSRARQLIRAGDVLVSTVRPNLNGVALVPPELDGATASTGFCVLRPRASQLDARYLYQWVKSPRFVRDMVRKATGASYPAVSDRIVRESKLPLPPLPEQRRIAETLDKADALRSKRRAALAQLDTLTQSIFLDMFGDPVTNPKGWPRAPLIQHATVTYGFPFDSQHFGQEGKRKVVRIRDVVRGESETRYSGGESFEAKHVVKDGDILVGMDGEFNCARWRGGEALLNQRVCKFAARGAALDETFLFRVLPSFLKRIEAETPFVTVKHLSAKRINQIQIPLPSPELQREFARRAVLVDRQIEALNSSASEMNALFASLQNRAFRGEL